MDEHSKKNVYGLFLIIVLLYLLFVVTCGTIYCTIGNSLTIIGEIKPTFTMLIELRIQYINYRSRF